VLLLAAFGSGYLPARRDVRALESTEIALQGEIRLLRSVTERLRREIDAARHDPMYAEALARARTGGRLPGEPPAGAGPG
jgi:hypothetical protein